MNNILTYHLTLSVGSYHETTPVSNDERTAFEVATWVMQGYMKDGYQIKGNLKDVWVAHKEGGYCDIVLRLHAIYPN